MWLFSVFEVVEEADGGFGEEFAGAGGAAGADGFVVALLEGFFGGDVADGAVGELGDDGAAEGGGFFDGQTQLDEDFAGEADPGDIVAEGDHLHIDLPGFSIAGGDVDDFEGVDAIEECRGVLAEFYGGFGCV